MPVRTLLYALLAVFLLATPALGAEEVRLRVAWWSALPFVGLLLSIALVPLALPHFWHSNFNKAIVAALFAVPVAAYLLYLEQVEHQKGLLALWHGLEEYLSFIILLWTLYTIAGGIAVDLRVKGGPVINSVLLLIGALSANLIGTTGAAMLLIRPFLRINNHRTTRSHLPIFFVFMVCNVGGLLTPLGDPPLFLGFLRGVSFFWTLQLWPQWLLVNGMLLCIFFIWDTVAQRRDGPVADTPQEPGPILSLKGRVNFLFLLGVIVVVLLESPAVAKLLGQGVEQTALERPWGELAKICLGLLSLVFTRRSARRANDFSWGAILEVGVIFAGVFVCMVPALKLLESIDRVTTGLVHPWQYFWLSGMLSSFLDNAPTYLSFATMAAGEQTIRELSQTSPELLAAISCGSVFMGANTYIGNGPNFMVKAIAEEHQYPMPSFFGYLLRSIFILLPIFGVVTWVFFRP